jgi:hypothetical protein
MIAIIGCGGVGSIIAPVIAKMTKQNIILVDGDIYEQRNLERQQFPASAIGKTKATVLANRLEQENPSLEVTAIESFYTEFTRLPDSVTAVFVCIDNNKGRKHIVGNASDALYVFCANENETGDAFVWRKGQDFPQHLLAETEEEVESCQVRVQEVPQLAMANMAAATAGLYLWYAHTHPDFENVPRLPTKHSLMWSNFITEHKAV